jgi:hypothetical protein
MMKLFAVGLALAFALAIAAPIVDGAQYWNPEKIASEAVATAVA